METELQQIERMFRELQNHPPVFLQLNAFDAWTLIGLIQLALRHPGTAGKAADGIRSAMLLMQDSMLLSDEMKQWLDNGWQSEFDRPIDKVGEFVTVKTEDFVGISEAFILACELAALSSGASFEEIERTARMHAVERLENFSDAEILKAIKKYYESVKNDK